MWVRGIISKCMHARSLYETRSPVGPQSYLTLLGWFKISWGGHSDLFEFQEAMARLAIRGSIKCLTLVHHFVSRH
jgi:hypothetical protein